MRRTQVEKALPFVANAQKETEAHLYSLQIYYCEYYEKYLEEYERRRLMMMNENSATASAAAAMAASSQAAASGPYGDASTNAALVAGNVEASILMDDIMNNGMTFCSIM